MNTLVKAPGMRDQFKETVSALAEVDEVEHLPGVVSDGVLAQEQLDVGGTVGQVGEHHLAQFLPLLSWYIKYKEIA